MNMFSFLRLFFVVLFNVLLRTAFFFVSVSLESNEIYNVKIKIKYVNKNGFVTSRFYTLRNAFSWHFCILQNDRRFRIFLFFYFSFQFSLFDLICLQGRSAKLNIAFGQKLFQLLWSKFASQLLFGAFKHFRF